MFNHKSLKIKIAWDVVLLENQVASDKISNGIQTIILDQLLSSEDKTEIHQVVEEMGRAESKNLSTENPLHSEKSYSGNE